MIHLIRPDLPLSADRYLAKKTSEIRGLDSQERKPGAHHAWSTKSQVRFGEIRGVLTRMASGVGRCMYCEDSRGTDIDHFAPKALEPERAFDWSNYFLACSTCNSNFKRDEFPVDADGAPLLVNPVDDRPSDHWTLSPTTGRYEAAAGSLKAGQTFRVFGLNRDDLQIGRSAAWPIFAAAIMMYAQAREAGADEFAETVRRAALLQSFAAVLEAILIAARSDDPDIPLPMGCREAIRRYPEIADWLNEYRAAG